MSAVSALEAGGVALAAHVAIATVLVRLKRKRSPVLLHLASAGFVCAALIGLIFYFGGENEKALWLSVSILYGGAVGFLFLFSAVYKSISLEILCALTAALDQRLSPDAITRLVLPRFTERIELLVTNRLVSQTGDRYAITEEGRRLALRFSTLRRLVGIAQSGLYAREATK